MGIKKEVWLDLFNLILGRAKQEGNFLCSVNMGNKLFLFKRAFQDDLDPEESIKTHNLEEYAASG